MALCTKVLLGVPMLLRSLWYSYCPLFVSLIYYFCVIVSFKKQNKFVFYAFPCVSTNVFWKNYVLSCHNFLGRQCYGRCPYFWYIPFGLLALYLVARLSFVHCQFTITAVIFLHLLFCSCALQSVRLLSPCPRLWPWYVVSHLLVSTFRNAFVQCSHLLRIVYVLFSFW